MFDDCGEAYRAVIALANDEDERSVGNERSMECRIWCRCLIHQSYGYSRCLGALFVHLHESVLRRYVLCLSVEVLLDSIDKIRLDRERLFDPNTVCEAEPGFGIKCRQSVDEFAVVG